MPRFLDLTCTGCGVEVNDLFVMKVPSHIVHFECGEPMEQVYRLRSRSAQWSDREAVVVFRKPDGTISYPATNTKATPLGCERIVMKSMSEVDSFCRTHNVMNVMRDFDRGTDRDHSTVTSNDVARSTRRERQRYERFREVTRGVFGASGGRDL
jgi:hypothetical protein